MTTYILLILLLFSAIIDSICVDYGFGIGVRGRGSSSSSAHLSCFSSVLICIFNRFSFISDSGDILLEEFLFTNVTAVPANITIKFKYVAAAPVSFIEFVSDNVSAAFESFSISFTTDQHLLTCLYALSHRLQNIQTEITFFKRHMICLRIMDRFVYSLNGTVVVYGYDNFDGLTPSERNDAVLLPRRVASNESELDDLFAYSFCTTPNITFDEMRDSFNDVEFDNIDDAYDDFLENDLSLLSSDYYAKSDDKSHDVIKDLDYQQQPNCSMPNEAFIRFYMAKNDASTQASQHRLAISIYCIFLFHNFIGWR